MCYVSHVTIIPAHVTNPKRVAHEDCCRGTERSRVPYRHFSRRPLFNAGPLNAGPNYAVLKNPSTPVSAGVKKAARVKGRKCVMCHM